jgi:hypothetical protein
MYNPGNIDLHLGSHSLVLLLCKTAAMKTITKSLGVGSKKRRAQQLNNNKNNHQLEDLTDVVVAPQIHTETSVETRAMETMDLPNDFTVVSMTTVGTQSFTLRPVTVGSYYRFRVAVFNRAGSGKFSTANHPPTQIPNRNQYIAIKAEEKRKEEHKEMMANLEQKDLEEL